MTARQKVLFNKGWFRNFKTVNRRACTKKVRFITAWKRVDLKINPFKQVEHSCVLTKYLIVR